MQGEQDDLESGRMRLGGLRGMSDRLAQRRMLPTSRRGSSCCGPTRSPAGTMAAQPPAHWIISQGSLTGTAESTPLLSGWTVDDFELRFEWSTTCRRRLDAWPARRAQRARALRSRSRRATAAARFATASKTLAPGTSVEALARRPCTRPQIRRFGSTLTVIVDGRVVSEVEIDRNRRFGLSLAVPAGEATLANLRLKSRAATRCSTAAICTGWHVNNDKGTWTVDERRHSSPPPHTGCTTCAPTRNTPTSPGRSSTRSPTAATRASPFAPHKDGWPSGDGMELQILDRPGEVKDSTMAIYGNLPPLDRADDRSSGTAW